MQSPEQLNYPNQMLTAEAIDMFDNTVKNWNPEGNYQIGSAAHNHTFRNTKVILN